MSHLPKDTFKSYDSLEALQKEFDPFDLLKPLPLYQLEFFFEIVTLKKDGELIYKARRRELPAIIGGQRRIGKTFYYKRGEK